jgi:hypothetical protein
MVALAQSVVTGSGTTGTTLTLTLGSATTAGNCLVVCISSHTGATNNPTINGVTLGGSADNFASILSTGGLTDESFSAIWADPLCAGGQTSVVITFGSGTSPRYLASVYEFSGLAITIAALPDKSAAAATGSNGTSWSSGSTATTSQAVELWIGLVTSDSTTITGPASPWVNTAEIIPSGAASDFMSGYQIRSSTGAAAYAGTFSPLGYYNAAVVALYSATNVMGVAAQVTVTAGVGTFAGGANISGVAAQVTVTAGVGTFHAGAGVTGIAAQVTVTAGIGTYSINVGVSGVAAQVTVTAGIGTISSGSPNAAIIGTAAQINVTAGIGSAVAVAAGSGVAANVTVTAGIGIFAAAGGITGIASHVTVTAGIGTISAGGMVNGSAAQVTVTAGIGSFDFSAAIVGVAAQVTVTAGIGLPAGTPIFPKSPLGTKIELNINGTWRDITTYVYLRDNINISDIGRPNESSTIQPGQCTLTLNNRDGRFSPKYSPGAYYPYIQRNTQLRVSVLAASSTGFAYSGYRFYGEVSEWPPVSDITGNDIYVQITASGIWRRLSRASANIGSAYTRYNNTLNGLAGYWPMEDGSGSLDFSPGVLGGSVMAFTSGTPNLAATAAFPGSNAIPALNGAVLTGPISTSGSHTINRFRFLVFVPSGGDSGIPANSVLASLHTNGTVNRVDILLGAAGGGPFVIKGYNSGGTNTFTGTTGSVNVFGIVILAEISLSNSGSNVAWALTLYLPGTSSPYGSASGTLSSASVGNATSIVFNSGAAYKGTAVGQGIVLYDTSPSLVTAADALQGHQGETALARFVRICTEQGIATETIGSSSVQMGPQYDGTFAAVLQTIENSDQGLLYETRDQLGLGYRAYNSMVDQSPAVTIDYSAHMLSAVPTTTYDDQGVVNDVTLNNYDGYSYRLQLASGAMSINPPPNGVGDYPGQPLGVNLYATGEAAAIAQVAKRVLNPGVVDELRIPNLAVNLARSAVASLFGTIPALFVGDYVALSNPPSWLSSTNPSKQIVVGYAETLSNYEWTIVYNTIPEVGYESAFNPGTTVGGRTSGSPVTGGQAGSVSGADIGGGAITTGGLAGYVTSASIGGITSSVGTIAPIDPNTGDIWIDAANGYQIKRFDGSNWIPITFTASSVLAAGSITAAQIAVGTITASLLAAGIVVAGIVNATTITGASIVAYGSTGELLAYSGIPATGNLLMSASAAAGTDGNANNYLAGFTIYGSNGSKIHIYTSGTAAVMELPSGGASEASPSQMKMTVFNQGAGNEHVELRIGGPVSSYDNNSVNVVMDSSAADGSSTYNGVLEVGGSSAAGWGPGTLGTQLTVTHQLLIGGATGGAQVETSGNVHVGGSIIIGAGSFPVAAPSAAGAPSSTYNSAWASSVTNVVNNLRTQLILAGIIF